MKYEILMPFVLNYSPYAITFVALGFIFKYFAETLKIYEDKRAFRFADIFYISMGGFIAYVFIFIPSPFPGISITGSSDGLHHVSSFVWLIDQLEAGSDALVVDLIDKDLTIRTYSDEFKTPYVEGGIPVVTPPEKEDLLYYFIAQRGRFLMLVGEANLNTFRIETEKDEKGALAATASFVTGGASDAIRVIATFPDRIFASLGSLLLAIGLNGIMAVLAILILGFASLIKYGIALYTLMVIFIFPIAEPFSNGFWKKVAKQYLVLFLWKPLIVLLVWFSFLMIEAVNLDALLKANQVLGNTESVVLVQSSLMKPGALYTPLGGETFEEQMGLLETKFAVRGYFLEATLVSFGILVLLFFLILAIPAVLMRLLGESPFLSSFISGAAAIAAGSFAKMRIMSAMKGGTGGGSKGGALQGSNAEILKNASTTVPEKEKEGK